VNAEVARLQGRRDAGYTVSSPPRYHSVDEFLASPRFPYIYYLYVEPR
jgi:hypothetical protein